MEEIRAKPDASTSQHAAQKNIRSSGNRQEASPSVGATAGSGADDGASLIAEGRAGEIRKPKSSDLKKAEARNPKRPSRPFRTSDLGLPSAFGLRASDFAPGFHWKPRGSSFTRTGWVPQELWAEPRLPSRRGQRDWSVPPPD